MAKVLLMSILVATVALPIRLARAQNARRGYRRTLLWSTALTLLWGILVASYYLTLAADQ